MRVLGERRAPLGVLEGFFFVVVLLASGGLPVRAGKLFRVWSRSLL